MRLSQQAVDELLHVIFSFSRTNGIPYNYYDLEQALQAMTFEIQDDAISTTPTNKEKVRT